MFGKKRTPVTPARNVRPQQKANVFSYHASRSVSDGGAQTRRAESQAPKQRRKFMLAKSQLVAYAPSLFAGLALMFCLIYVSTLSDQPKLQIVGDQKNTAFVSAKTEYEAGVQSIFAESVFNRSKLLINTNEIADKIKQQYPELGEVTVVLPLAGRRPVVQASPAKPALVMGTQDGGLVIDTNGLVIADARDIESSIIDKLPAIEDESGLSLERGNYALPSETVYFIRVVAAQLNAAKVDVQSMVLPPVANEMHVRLEGKPYYVKFDMRGEGRAQSGTLLATKNKLEKDGTVPRQYIDVRVPGKIFYK